MKLSLLIASRPIFFFMLLVIVVLMPSSLLIRSWYKMTQNIEHVVDEILDNLVSSLSSQVERTAKILHPLNSSAICLASLLTSQNVNGSDELSFSEIQNKVAPALFNAFVLTPHISKISYVGVGGLFISYYINTDQTLTAVYSNSSKTLKLYTQNVNPKTGILYGEPAIVQSSLQNLADAKWFREALNSSTGYASLGPAINNASEFAFYSAASVHSGKGVVGLGFSAEELVGLFKSTDFFGGSLYLATTNTGKVLAGEITKTPLSNQSGAGYYSSITDIVGVKLVYAVSLVGKWSSITHLVHKTSREALIHLIAMEAVMAISILSFVLLLIRDAKLEMKLRAKLIKQMEATQQAERKNLNKTLAFSAASHDIRSALIAIDAYIDLSQDISLYSELKASLDQIKSCTKQLGGLLNSVLDMSKIESGKMQLDEEEFNMAELVEHAVDLFHPGGMKKGVDIILDLCDGSILKFSKVRGDRGKLNQILNNLLSNAVKFTSQGHVTVRAWARKQKPNNVQLMLDDFGYKCWLLEYFHDLIRKKNENKYEDVEFENGAERQNTNLMEFIFEVDDTGKGIPKEKRESVFENFVQVKETALGLGGTGLGLGIVQSLVRLMGGEIAIVNKDVGKEGTCFRFNVYLTVTGTNYEDIFGSGEESKSGLLTNLAMCSPVDGRSLHSSSTRLNFLNRKPEGSHVILFMGDEERQRVLHKFMESQLGINVSVVNRWDNPDSTLRKLKSKRNPSHYSVGSSGKLEVIAWSLSDTSSGHSKDIPLSSMDGTDQRLRLSRKKGSSPSFLAMVIDVTVGVPYTELQNFVEEIRSGLPIASFKVIWLNKPTSGIDRDKFDPRDDVLLQPLRGLWFYHHLIKHLPEFGGVALPRSLSKQEKENPSSSSAKQANNPPPRAGSVYQGEIEEVESSDKEISGKKFSTRDESELGQQSEIQECFDFPSEKRTPQSDTGPLTGKRILVAEDTMPIRKLAERIISRLGATVDLCENGEEVINLVHGSLEDQKPYDFILMDCQMPIKNGYEATSWIRNEEKIYGVHILIIACTAGSFSGEEAEKSIECGMDDFISKPLKVDNLMESLRRVNQKLHIVGTHLVP